MKTIIIKIYHRIYNRILDYRYKISGHAGICFAYYLIMSVIPICSLCAFVASLLNIDMSLLESLFTRYLSSDMSSIIMTSLKSPKLSLATIVVLVISLFVVSRGIHQLYAISKNLFPSTHQRHFLVEQLILIFKTLAVFVLLLLMISLLTIIPIIHALNDFVDIFMVGDLTLFIFFFVIMFLLYKIIPDVHVHVVDIFKGALTSSILLMILFSVLSIYFEVANYTSVYGPLSSIVVLMISFTFIAEMIFIGMYVMFEAHMKRLIDQLKEGRA